jgi:hypothetical protein
MLVSAIIVLAIIVTGLIAGILLHKKQAEAIGKWIETIAGISNVIMLLFVNMEDSNATSQPKCALITLPIW